MWACYINASSYSCTCFNGLVYGPFVGEGNVGMLYDWCILQLHMFEWLVYCPNVGEGNVGMLYD